MFTLMSGPMLTEVCTARRKMGGGANFANFVTLSPRLDTMGGRWHNRGPVGQGNLEKKRLSVGYFGYCHRKSVTVNLSP